MKLNELSVVILSDFYLILKDRFKQALEIMNRSVGGNQRTNNREDYEEKDVRFFNFTYDQLPDVRVMHFNEFPFALFFCR